MALACVFCDMDPSRIVLKTDLAYTIRDGFPVSPGHTLIIPRRHVASFFDCTPSEQAALLSALGESRENIIKELNPSGFNIGINDGADAGQTVPHLHIHLIPRFHGDQTDPRGGVRWIFPDKAAYWKDR